jgi:alpha-L-rhamnosidase
MKQTRVTQLRTEYLDNPLGIDHRAPRFSWKLKTVRSGARQTAYRIVADGWDSGKVKSDQSVHVAWAGPALKSCQHVSWRVHVWDETGAETVSAPASFELGILDAADWRGARWVRGPLTGGPYTPVPLPRLERAFALDKPVASARLYVSALGIYTADLNGAAVGELELAPGWTSYVHRVRYQVYDVSKQLKRGSNVLGAELGDGWFAGHIGWRERGVYGNAPALLALLIVTHPDGSETVVASDESWRVAYGPRLQADLMQGEHYDARLPWANWAPAVLATPPDGLQLDAQNSPPMRATEHVLPIRDPYEHNGVWIFDLGQNMVGRVRLNINGPAGTTLRLRYAEVLEKGPLATSGPIYTANLRSAANIDYYTLRGDLAGESFETRFTFHGFRYVEVRGLPAPPTRALLTGIVVHSDTPRAGSFDCSDAMVNQLVKNIDWGQRGNFLDVPTDCPQRDERLGWTGDAQVFARTAAFNRDVAGFFHKWMTDMRDSQTDQGEFPMFAPRIVLSSGMNGFGADGGPAWSDAGVIVPWTMYVAYGDTQILKDNYAAMRRFVDFWDKTARDGIRCYDDYAGWKGFGDWLALDGSGIVFGGTPKDLIGTAFYAYSAHLFSKIAAVLGIASDAKRYRAMFEKAKRAFNRRYVTADGLIAPMTQTAGFLALQFELLAPALRPKVIDWIVRDIASRGDKTSTGFAGSAYVPHVLCEFGRADVASKLLFQKGWPSYLYAVTQGATTIWERWDGWTHDKGFQDAGMNSFNHYAYGAVGAWLYQRVAGIDTSEDGVGYKHIRFRPIALDGLTHASATLDTPYGVVESGWKRVGKRLTYRFVVPPNATATVELPGADAPVSLDPGEHKFTIQSKI